MEPEIRMYDLYDVWYHPFWQQGWFRQSMIAFGVLCIAVVVVLMYWWWAKRRKKAVPAWSHALQAFATLQPEHYRQQEAQLFYTRLCLIFKEYLMQHYQVNLIDKSDQEVINFFCTYGLSPELADQIEKVLQGAITIKFAKQSAAHEHMIRDLQKCVSFVQQTRMVEKNQAP